MTRIALLGPYASRNLGDTATQLAVLAELRRRRPGVELVGVTHEPEDALASLGIPAFPLRGIGAASGALATQFPWAAVGTGPGRLARWAALRRIDAFVRRLSLLVISGGGQLDDFWGGPWDHPWLLFAWTALARRHGVPVAYLAVGVDHLRSPVSRRLVTWGLRLARHRSFRDAGSLATLRALGLGGGAVQCPDVVFGMDDPGRPHARAAVRFAVINPITRKTWATGDDARHDAYLAGLEALGVRLAAEGLALRIACSQTAMDGADAEHLATALRARGIAVRVDETPTVDRYLDAVRGAELVVASRFHGVILSLVAGSPVVALAPLPKVERVMSEFGLDAFCLPLQRFDAADLVARSTLALADATLTGRIAATVRRYRGELAAVYDDLESLLDAPTASRANAGSVR